MRINRVVLENIRCFQAANLELSKTINIVTGHNNSGKTTLLESINEFLHGGFKIEAFSRTGVSKNSSLHIDLKNGTTISGTDSKGSWTVTQTSNGSGQQAFQPWRLDWPDNHMHFLSGKRGRSQIKDQINEQAITKLSGDFSGLSARLDYVLNPANHLYADFLEACSAIFGRPISLAYSGGGKVPAIVLDGGKSIPIQNMGSGVPHALFIAVEILLANNNVIVIEELERDLHPVAIRALCSMIQNSSKNNQYILTTHSNVVLSSLSTDSTAKVFKVDQLRTGDGDIPISNINEVEAGPKGMVRVLADLGYDLIDAGLYDRWLFFEESSAEEIVRDYLIPWFFPESNGKVRTYSTNGIGNVRKRFEQLNKMFVFANLSEMYVNRAAVIIDGGVEEEEVIDDLKKVWCGNNEWDEGCFLQFDDRYFECYYPEPYQTSGVKAAEVVDVSKRRTEKAKVLKDLLAAMKADPERLKSEWSQSGAKVIDILGKVLESRD